MASTTVIHQPGLSYQKEYSGSVQYIGGYDEGDDGDVFSPQKKGADNGQPIPMGLEVFENVSKLVAHQNVTDDEGKKQFNCFTPRALSFNILHTERLWFQSKNLQTNKSDWIIKIFPDHREVPSAG